MAKKLKFKVKGQDGQLVEQEYTAQNTWQLRGQELLRHEHYVEMSTIVGISPSEVHCDIKPTKDNQMVSYRVGGNDINGLMHYAVGSAAPENVKMTGAYLPEMAYKRAFDSWVTSALGLTSHGIGSQEAVDYNNIHTDEIGQPELVQVNFGKNRGKTLGEIWTENPDWITNWLCTDKFEPRNQDGAFLKQAGIALMNKQGGVGNNAGAITANTQQQPPSASFQQPPQQAPQEDINMLKSQLQQFWASQGYTNEEAGKVINDGFRSDSITWQNINIDQVKHVLSIKENAFPPKNQGAPQQQAPQQQMPSQQQPQQQMQQQVPPQQPPQQAQQQMAPPQQQPMQQPQQQGQFAPANQPPFGQQQAAPQQQAPQQQGGQAFCQGEHAQPKELRKHEIDFCNQNAQKFGGKLYCLSCQDKFLKGTLNTSQF